MPDQKLAITTPATQRSSKRRRVDTDSAMSTPRYSSPDPLTDEKRSPATRRLAVRRGRRPSRSVSPSDSMDDELNNDHYHSARSSLGGGGGGGGPSRSRTGSSRRSRSRGRSRTPSNSRSRSRARSTSPSRSPFESRSRSATPSRDSRGRSPSSSSSACTTASSHTRRRRRRRRQSQRQRQQQQEKQKPQFRRYLELRGHNSPISQVRISPDGRWIASASADGTARIWDAATGAHMETLVGHMAGVSCLAWSPDSDTLATGSDDKAIRLWDRVTAEPAHAGGGGGGNGRIGGGLGARGSRKPLLGHHNYVYCMAFSPKGNILASGSYDEAVFLWDVRAGRLMRSLPAHSDPVSGIDFCRDGTLVVSCSTDGLIRIWDTSTGQCLRTLLLLDEDNPAVTNVCFSPNGRYVLAFNLDSCIRLWDYIPHPSTVKKTYQGHRNASFSIGGCFGVLPPAPSREGGGRRRERRAEEDEDEEEEEEEEEDVDDDEEAAAVAGEDVETGRRRRRRQAQGRPFVAAASEDGDVVLWDVVSKEVVQRIRGVHDGVCFWVDVCGQVMVSAGKDGKIVVFRNGAEEAPAPAVAAVKEEVVKGEEESEGTEVNGVNGVNGVKAEEEEEKEEDVVMGDAAVAGA